MKVFAAAVVCLVAWPCYAQAPATPQGQVDAVLASVMREVTALGNRILQDDMRIAELTGQLAAVTKERDELKKAAETRK